MAKLKLSSSDQEKLKQFSNFIKQRRQNGEAARIIKAGENAAAELAGIIAAGGVVIMSMGQESRRIPILAARYDDSEVTKILNELKGRPSRQVLALGDLEGYTHLLADLRRSPSLKRAAQKLHKTSKVTQEHLVDTVRKIYHKNAIGLLLHAQKSLPKAVISGKGDSKIVMLVGASDPKDQYDIYNKTLKLLIEKYSTILAGTSVNNSGEPVVSYRQQDDIYEKFKTKVDAVLKYEPMEPGVPHQAASTTVLDLTQDKAKIKRWGNQHPRHFKKFFPELAAKEAESIEENAETLLGYIRNKISSPFG